MIETSATNTKLQSMDEGKRLPAAIRVTSKQGSRAYKAGSVGRPLLAGGGALKKDQKPQQEQFPMKVKNLNSMV